MPTDSLVGLGNPGSRPVTRPSLHRPSHPPPAYCPPRFPGDPPPTPVTAKAYFSRSGTVCSSWQPPVSQVRISPATVPVHVGWRRTALAPALQLAPPALPGAPPVIDKLVLSAVTPAMFEALPVVTRESLMRCLGAKNMPTESISWRDSNGKLHARHSIFGLPVGFTYKVNPATALVMQLAATGGKLTYVKAMQAGLRPVVEELRDKSRGLFDPGAVAAILRASISPTTLAQSPSEVRSLLAACGDLICNYLDANHGMTPIEVENGVRDLLHELGPLILVTPQTAPEGQAQVVGAVLGAILAGAFKYADSILQLDNKRRWRVASASNMLWASTSFIPIPTVAGAAAAAVVGTAIAWDTFHPARDYQSLVRQMSAELQILVSQRKIASEEQRVAEILRWMGHTLGANGFSV